MATKRSLTLYLQGHHAGAEAAVVSVRQQAAIDADSEIGRLLARLGDEIAEDMASLRDVMAKLAVRPSVVKNLGARVTAHLSRWTLRAHLPGPPQAQLIGLESLSLGIEGKLRLWCALREIAADDPRLGEIDFDALIKRAERQRVQLEPHRLEAVRQANANAEANNRLADAPATPAPSATSTPTASTPATSTPAASTGSAPETSRARSGAGAEPLPG
ncbi:MAG TPA: hypothetical protein VGO78_23975 [Acidimicrobiales bacterium]|nr:hypothetical protein [Acidimicrobiales bacterium]